MTRHLVDYFNVDSSGTEVRREFDLINDTSSSRYFCQQKARKISDSICEIEFVFFKADSSLIQKSVERYSMNNTYQLMEQSLFIRDSTGNMNEKKAIFINSKPISVNDSAGIVEMLFRPYLDTSIELRIKQTLKPSFQIIDSLGENSSDCLVMQNLIEGTYHYNGLRKDTTVTGVSLGIYSKGAGLVLFGQGPIGKMKYFKLKKS
jgi:hypothetical protein